MRREVGLNQLAGGQTPEGKLLRPVMMVRRMRVVESRGYVRGNVAPVLAPIIVDGPEGMQRSQRAVYEARQGMELGRLPSDEVTIQIGSQPVHGPLYW